MDEKLLRCRKCRHVLFTGEYLLSPIPKTTSPATRAAESGNTSSLPSCDTSSGTLLYVNWDKDGAPEWLVDALQQSQFSDGKLVCGKCAAKIGAFDFVTPVLCVCTRHPMPPVRIAKNRVDICALSPVRHIVRMRTAAIRLGSSHASADADASSHHSKASPSSWMPSTSSQHSDKPSSTETISSSSSSSDFSNLFNIKPSGATSDAQSECGMSSLDSLTQFIRNGANSAVSAVNVLRSEASQIASLTEPGTSEPECSEQEEHLPGVEETGVDLGNISDADEGNAVASVDDISENEDVVANPPGSCQGTQVASEEEEDVTECVPSSDSEAYTCPICLEIYYLPHTCHPCQHIFCAPCLRRLRGTVPISTKCPLCREVICACLPNHELCNKVKSVFPDEYRNRKSAERRVHRKLPPLPSNTQQLPFGHSRPNRNRGANLVLAHWAGVCFVVLLCMFAVAVLATTVAMTAWYMWEWLMEELVVALISINEFFDLIWQNTVVALIDGNVNAQDAKIVMGSFGQVLYALGKLFNRTNEKSLTDEAAKVIEPYLSTAAQADIANYMLVMGFVTFMIYQLARYMQTRQQEAQQMRE